MAVHDGGCAFAIDGHDVARLQAGIHVGRFCEVATRHGTVYGELVRLSAVSFLIRPRFAASVPPRSLRADEITQVTPLPDPRR